MATKPWKDIVHKKDIVEAARPQPPTPHCECVTPICAWRLGAIRCDRCTLPVSQLTVPAAPEPVEQAPRPTCTCNRLGVLLRECPIHPPAAPVAVEPRRTRCQHNNLRLIRKSVDGHRLDLYHCNDCQGIVDVERLTEKPWEHDEGCRDGNCEHPDRIEEANKAERALLQEMDGVNEWEAVKLLRDYISDRADSQRTEGAGQK